MKPHQAKYYEQVLSDMRKDLIARQRELHYLKMRILAALPITVGFTAYAIYFITTGTCK